jgi:hypothetical protein
MGKTGNVLVGHSLCLVNPLMVFTYWYVIGTYFFSLRMSLVKAMLLLNVCVSVSELLDIDTINESEEGAESLIQVSTLKQP